MNHRDKITNKKKWLTLDDCTQHIVSLGHNITKTDLIQFGLQGDLVLSTYFQHQLGRPVFRYCSLPDITKKECIYRHIAERYLRDSISDSIITAEEVIEEKSRLLDLNSNNFPNQMSDSINSYQYKLKQKTEEVFERWKKKAHPHIKYDYGSLVALEGVYSLELGSTLHDSLMAFVHDPELDKLMTDGLVVNDINSEEFMLFNNSGEHTTLALPVSALIVQSHHFYEFISHIDADGAIPYKFGDIQSAREELFNRYIRAVDVTCFSQRRIDVWSELSKIDYRLFPHRDDPNDDLVKKFFDKQTLATFKKGRPKTSRI